MMDPMVQLAQLAPKASAVFKGKKAPMETKGCKVLMDHAGNKEPKAKKVKLAQMGQPVPKVMKAQLVPRAHADLPVTMVTMVLRDQMEPLVQPAQQVQLVLREI